MPTGANWSAFFMYPNKFEKREKDARATQRAINKLCKERWSGGWIEVPPFQHGWIRDWTLRDDVSRRADAGDLRLILDRINNQQWCKERDFLGHSWGNRGRRNRVPMDTPGLRVIEVRPDPYTGEETGFPANLKKKWFYYHGVNAPFCSCYARKDRVQYYRPAHYQFRHPWMFELRIRPAFISRVPNVDGDMESKLARLEQHMQANQYWPLLARLHGHSVRYRYDRESFRGALHRKITDRETVNELEEITK